MCVAVSSKLEPDPCEMQSSCVTNLMRIYAGSIVYIVLFVFPVLYWWRLCDESDFYYVYKFRFALLWCRVLSSPFPAARLEPRLQERNQCGWFSPRDWRVYVRWTFITIALLPIRLCSRTIFVLPYAVVCFVCAWSKQRKAMDAVIRYWRMS